MCVCVCVCVFVKHKKKCYACIIKATHIIFNSPKYPYLHMIRIQFDFTNIFIRSVVKCLYHFRVIILFLFTGTIE